MGNDGTIPEKISRTIVRYSNLILKLSVKLKDENGTFHNEFSFGSKSYINVNFASFITMELAKENDQMYDPSRSFLIGQGNIGSVVKSFKKVLQSIYSEKIFAMQNNKIIIYEDMVKKYTEQLTIPRLAQALLIKPAVIYDENETSYEGVNIFVNKLENIVELSIDEFENLTYVLEKIDIFQYSQLLLNYYVSSRGSNSDLTSIKKVNPTYTKTIDWVGDKAHSRSKTVSNYAKPERDVLDDFL